MVTRRSPVLPNHAVVLFGDGTLPEILLTCLQFRVVADLVRRRRALPIHRLQLHRHLARGCPDCAAYITGVVVDADGRRPLPPRG